MVRALVRKAGDPGSNPGSGENFSLKLTVFTCPFYDLVVSLSPPM